MFYRTKGGELRELAYWILGEFVGEKGQEEEGKDEESIRIVGKMVSKMDKCK